MTATATLRVGTRGSRLAMAQARIAIAQIEAHDPGPIEVVPIATRGDAISLRRPRGGWVATDGQFTGELERALLARRVDVVVHSYKDLPTAPVDGLAIAAILERADPRDCLLTREGGGLDDVPFGGRVATSSPRRAAQLATIRSDIIAVSIRGNVESRLRRLDAGEFDGLILAAAGLDRLGVEVPEKARMPLEVMLPAPAQGALALQVRSDSSHLRTVLVAVDHPPTRIAVEAERALLRAIGGGCLAPLGALAEVDGSTLSIRAAIEDRTGTLVRSEATGPVEDLAAVVASAAGGLVGARGA
jgi:hydroxymethylbilane synthase